MTFEIHSKKYGVHVVEIDDEDAEKVFQHTWHISCSYAKDGSPRHFSIKTHIKEKTGYRHTSLSSFLISGCVIDHIDGNFLNNHKSNLRVCTNAENSRNRRKHKNTFSGFKGVYANKKRWFAAICKDGQQIYLGNYKTAQEAAAAYNSAARNLFGSFARLNSL